MTFVHLKQELLLLNSSPSTIHSEGWIVDWVERARDFDYKEGWFNNIFVPNRGSKLKI